MDQFVYPTTLTPDPQDGGFVVTFVDVPEAITQGDDVSEALHQAADCLEEAIVGPRRTVAVRRERSPALAGPSSRLETVAHGSGTRPIRAAISRQCATRQRAKSQWRPRHRRESHETVHQGQSQTTAETGGVGLTLMRSYVG